MAFITTIRGRRIYWTDVVSFMCLFLSFVFLFNWKKPIFAHYLKQAGIYGVLYPLVALATSIGIYTLTSMITSSMVVKLKAARRLRVQEAGPFTDVVIIGAGCAGCSIALQLSKSGKKITLIEREMSMPDRIVGELLQPGGVRSLERMGLDDCAKNDIDSIVVNGYALVQPGDDDCASNGLSTNGHSSSSSSHTLLTYPSTDPSSFIQYFGLSSSSSSRSESSPRGRSFHHNRFVGQLRKKCMDDANITVIEGTVTGFIEQKSCEGEAACVDLIIVGAKFRRKCMDANEVDEMISSPLTIVCDGITSSFRKDLSPAVVHQTGHFVGLVLKHDDDDGKTPLPFPCNGHVILARPSPILMYQISSTETRCLVDVTGKMPSIADGSMATHMKTVVAHQLPKSTRSAFIAAVETGQFKSMPNRPMVARSGRRQGAVLMGDSLNMRHPLTGGGMSVALQDAELLSKKLLSVDLYDWEKVNHLYREFLNERKPYAATVNVLANALYEVFSCPEGLPIREELRCGCYEYLARGGFSADGPVGLLAILTPSPRILTIHFFLVAFYTVKRMLKDGFSIARLVNVYLVMQTASKILIPMLVEENETWLSSWPIRVVIELFFGFSCEELNRKRDKRD